MKTEDIIAFVNSNEKEVLKVYLDRLIDNTKEATRLYNKYFLFLGFLIFLHFMLKNSTVENIQLGFINITDLSFVGLLLAPLFSLIYFGIAVTEQRKVYLMYQIKVIMNMTFQYDLESEDIKRNHYNQFNLSFLPFSFVEELSVILKPNRSFDLIPILAFLFLILPIMVFILMFNFLLLTEMSSFWCDSFMIKALIIGSWALYISSLLIFIKMGLDKKKHEKADEEFWEQQQKNQN